ncbi:S-methyl-5-thioribose-1-phosphate isomerase [Oceanithermus sp.]
MSTFRSIEWKGDRLVLLDQRRIPEAKVFLELTAPEEVAAAIREMAVRGAPAIGAAAAFGVVLAARRGGALAEADALLRASRPTAVNLFWALDRMKRVWEGFSGAAEALAAALEAEALRIAEEDVAANKAIGRHALELIPDEARILHHCNTGSLATVDYGTALGIVRIAFEAGKKVHAFLDETRPRLQGARLSAWELRELGIPHTVIADGASGHVMQKFGIDLVVVGADRIAANGDTANKIGTYNLAIAARHHGVPFYVAAPTSTVDLETPSGAAIPIEERAARELTHCGPQRVVPEGSPVYNPAFDVTPAELITAIVTEAGIAYPPFEESLPALVQKAQGGRS